MIRFAKPAVSRCKEQLPYVESDSISRAPSIKSCDVHPVDVLVFSSHSTENTMHLN
jgi:hypothetical protein